MKLLRKIIGLTLLVLHVILGILSSTIVFSRWVHPYLPASLPKKLVTTWSWILCKILRIRIIYHGERCHSPALFVANHISWLDVFALLGTFHVIFIVKQEVAKWPLLGYLVKTVGNLFMQRGLSDSSQQANRDLATRLTQGYNVLFFPEGTTTDGSNMNRFHGRLFQCAIQTEVLVQPVALRYPAGDGLSTIAPFIGEDTFFDHMWRVFGETEVLLEIWFCPPIAAKDKKRNELAHYTHQQISYVLEHKTFAPEILNRQ
jgi:1-acyl-sn-glycerol-3-phosphate acyltransferase